MTVTGLVLAAGGSRRLGEAKQLLPYRGRTLLDATLDMARSCHLDDLVVTLGGAAAEIRDKVDLTGVRVVENPSYQDGCGSSIRSAIPHIDTDRLILLLGDQPLVSPFDVRRVALVDAPIGVCRYADGLGHPFVFHRPVYDDLSTLHGDKAVWKLLRSGKHPVTEIATAGTVPVDVDTPEDYERLLANEES